MANRLVTDIILNLSGNLAQKGKQYGQSMTKLGSQSKAAFSMINNSAKVASQGIDRYGNRMIIGAGAIGFAFERTFVKTAAEFERYQTMLNKLQGSEQGGAQAMQWIQDFTMNTPYAVNQVTQSFVKLKAFGLDPMDGTMQAIADQAAMLGGTAESVDGIALALGQAWTKGKLQGEEALQLLERGVPVWDYLVEASKKAGQNNGFGYTAVQLQDMASKGQLTREAIKALIDMMGQKSQGAARKQMDTWNGMVSNMGDTWTVFQKDVMDSGAFEALKDQLKDFMDELDEMKQNGDYDKLVEDVGEGLVTAFEAGTETLKAMKEVGQEMLPILKAVGEGAKAISDAVGGYGNVAKILASVYAVNKAIRIGSPILKGGATIAGSVLKKGGKGANIANNIANLGATPVYVVNMPMNGLGGGPDIGGGGGNKPTTTPKKAGWKARALSGVNSAKYLASDAVRFATTALPIAYMAIETPKQAPLFDVRRKSEVDTSQLPENFPVSAGLLDVFDDLKRWLSNEEEPTKKPQSASVADAIKNFNSAYTKDTASPWMLAGQQYSGGGNLRVDIGVTDERITTKTSGSFPGLTVNPDSGIN